MEIKVLRVTKFSKASFRGFAEVQLEMDEESSVTIRGITIKEIEKDGNKKLMCFCPQQKNEKDGKYYDTTSVKGGLWWKINEAVLNHYNGGESPASSQSQQDQVVSNKKAVTAKNPFLP